MRKIKSRVIVGNLVLWLNNGWKAVTIENEYRVLCVNGGN